MWVERVSSQSKNDTGRMNTVKNEVFIGFLHENYYLVGG